MRSVFRNLQQSAKAALGGNREVVNPITQEEAHAAEQARIAHTLAQVAQIAYVTPEPTAEIEPPVVPAESVEPILEPDDFPGMYAALSARLAAQIQRAADEELPPELAFDSTLPAGWEPIRLASWLEQRGERAYRPLASRAILYRYFQQWDDGTRQQMWSVYVSSGDKPGFAVHFACLGPTDGRALPATGLHAEEPADCLAHVICRSPEV